MTTSAYKKHVEYHFEAAGTGFAITSVRAEDGWLAVEETRKNGQEDTHFYGELECTEGRWELNEESREHLETYESKRVADALEAYINEHGLPSNPKQ
jgi:hypothetical protein